MILAIDTGFNKTGWAVFDRKGSLVDFGVCILPKTRQKHYLVEDYHKWIIWQTSNLDTVLKKYPISLMALEMISLGGKSAKAIREMSMAMTIITILSWFNSVPILYTSAKSGKIALTGKSNATKKECMQAVRNIYKNKFDNITLGNFEHIADAVGVYRALQEEIKLFYAGKKKAGD